MSNWRSPHKHATCVPNPLPEPRWKTVPTNRRVACPVIHPSSDPDPARTTDLGLPLEHGMNPYIEIGPDNGDEDREDGGETASLFAGGCMWKTLPCNPEHPKSGRLDVCRKWGMLYDDG